MQGADGWNELTISFVVFVTVFYVECRSMFLGDEHGEEHDADCEGFDATTETNE